jgi:hypothetical protein
MPDKSWEGRKVLGKEPISCCGGRGVGWCREIKVSVATSTLGTEMGRVRHVSTIIVVLARKVFETVSMDVTIRGA